MAFPPMNQIIGRFLDQCEHRQEKEGEEVRRRIMYCQKIEQDYGGIFMPVRPPMCAQCQLKGSIDEVFLKTIVMRTLRQSIENIKLGFFRDQQEFAETILDQAFSLFGDDPDMVATLNTSMEEAVEYGNLEHPRAVKIAEKYS